MPKLIILDRVLVCAAFGNGDRLGMHAPFDEQILELGFGLHSG